jgi:hypothetical protein
MDDHAVAAVATGMGATADATAAASSERRVTHRGRVSFGMIRM